MATCDALADPYTVPDRVAALAGPVVRCGRPEGHEPPHRCTFLARPGGDGVYEWRDRTENMRRLIGLTPDEQEAMGRAMGRRVVSVEHDISDDGESLLIVFEGGDALAVEAKAQLDLTHLSPLAVNVVRMQWANPAPADGPPFFTGMRMPRSDAEAEEMARELREGYEQVAPNWRRYASTEDEPSLTVERYGRVHSWARVPLTGWRRLLWPWYRLRSWWGF